jgi:hypothetical protein
MTLLMHDERSGLFVSSVDHTCLRSESIVQRFTGAHITVQLAESPRLLLEAEEVSLPCSWQLMEGKVSA